MSTPQFHTDPLSSTHRFHKGPHLFSTQNPSVPHQKPLSSTPESLSSTQKTLGSTPPQFNILLSSKPKTPQFNTKTPLVWNCGLCGTEELLVWNWGIFGTEKEWPFLWNLCVELMGCGTEGDPSKTALSVVELPLYYIKFQVPIARGLTSLCARGYFIRSNQSVPLATFDKNR